jgi:outer membrane receptor protein involved in Fe transport
MRRIRRIVRVALALSAIVASPVLARAEPPGSRAVQSTGADDAFSLMQEQMVTGPGKRAGPLSETPSSVSVIPAAEIRAMGYRTLADALRWVRGTFVTYDRNYSYVGVRGLQRPGDYNDKVLLLLDGHTLNGYVYGDGFIGPELGLDMEDVERIEVVRGPGSALYGSYAVLAVVNVVTRQPRSQPPVSATALAGGERSYRGRVALGSSRPGGPEWHAGFSWLQVGGADLYFPEFAAPATFMGRAVGLDGERAVSFLGSARWAGARLTAKLNERAKTIPTASYGTVFGIDGNETWDGRDFVELAVTRNARPGVELSSRVYWDGMRYHGHYIYRFEPESPLVSNRDLGNGDQVGAEVRAWWAATRTQSLTFGVEGQRTIDIHIENHDEEPRLVYYDQRLRGGLTALYVQDELRLGTALIATLGARVDDASRYAAVASPRGDLVWAVDSRTRLKLLGGTAFRAPSPYEAITLRDETGPPAPGLKPEHVLTWEGTLERDAGALTASLTAYSTRVRDLIDLVAVDEIGNESYRNRARVRCRGLEGEMRYVPDASLRVRVATAWQRSNDEDTGSELTNSPRWNTHLLATYTPPRNPLSFGAGLRQLSPRLTFAGARTASALVCDARVACRLGAWLTAALEARNLFDARYGDPASNELLEDQIPQDARTLYLTIAYPPREGR